MTFPRWMLTLAAGALIVGCQAKKPEARPIATIDDATYTELRAAFEQAKPGSIVGRVVSVDGAQKAAEITDVPAASFQRGQVVLIIDAEQNPLASGTVFNTTENSVMVFYEVEAGGREPVAGDVAVRLPVENTASN